MVELSEDEKSHIREVEEYRREIRKEMIDGEPTSDKHWFRDKVAAPGVIVVITALAVGVVAPYVLQADADQKRCVELKSGLINDIVTESSNAQMAAMRYQEQLCDYWSASLDVAIKQRILERRPAGLDADGRKAEHEAIADARRRENSIRVEADKAYADSKSRRAAATARAANILKLYYGSPDALIKYIQAVSKESIEAETLINDTQQDALALIFTDAKHSLAACNDDVGCHAIIEKGSAEIERIRAQRPSFKQWNDETEALTTYIMGHEPDIGNHHALAAAFGVSRTKP